MSANVSLGSYQSTHDVHASHPVDVDVQPAFTHRNRLTCFFRVILALPHLILVGGPSALAVSIAWGAGTHPRPEWGGATGILGALAAVCALIAWFAIVFGGEYPAGLRDLAMLYLRWRVRVSAYTALLRDEYPPFGDGAYPAALQLAPFAGARNRLTVAFRLVLAIPQILAVWLLGVAWLVATIAGWISILFTGTYPETLFTFSVGALRWSTRVEAYLLLLVDEYPPFSLT